MATLKIGHRGAKGHVAENTLESIKKAMLLKVDMIEIDVHLCKTGELVVIHDEELGNTTSGNGVVSDKSLAQIKSFRTREGYQIPTLSEVLELIQDKVILNIELKGEGTAEPVLKCLQKFPESKILISSFSFNELMSLRSLNPEIPVAVLTENDLSMAFLQARHLKAFSIHPYYKMVTRDFIADCHRNDIKVYVWTVNKPEKIKKLKSLDVDGIFSDFPDRL
ncbi:glycerophosphodiester phosphodiesterase [Zunongwangia profunda]|uniref:Glycerophosphoryl diester phosphodiesterase n=2 Tax=Zunongwangia profunda TaxID=398743 RepID=D5BAJ0_ZUNPS|nr:glycerophosphodiester phosphodiesterase family protein [Zunongwangia profunda]ADF54516.1 glycerophosphoryl diester phosphodiesterase [Zunongwangia profunda SM-A87]MAS71178.1 glycerophosphodiester phosphodiesterase [Zunongwangia sp.]HAJ82450.1 glycerophosphodiester phosphodiesterase [Zunongwangia profunda]HCV81786.1 glycerophosphodiester phosphodiesterase [Zunongwangia profunda]|tara:strand:- start:11510 stop:12175 length:666 start_codon:yes stop_codon:yes gene_type:complete